MTQEPLFNFVAIGLPKHQVFATTLRASTNLSL